MAYLLSVFALGGCVRAQSPVQRPALANAALDEKLGGMLRYDVPLVSADSLALEPQPLLLDVREPEEYAVSHLPGAIQVAPRALPAWLDTVERDRVIVVYCSVGYRSERFGRDLRAAGFTEVRNLYGSIFEWVDRGYPVVDSAGPTAAVHTYNKRWGRWLRSPDVQKVY